MEPMDFWVRGLMTSGLGPELEWHPAPADDHQRVHDMFWKFVSGILPEAEDDEAWWMTPDAATALTNNN